MWSGPCTSVPPTCMWLDVEPAASAAGVVVAWCEIAFAPGERSVLHCSEHAVASGCCQMEYHGAQRCSSRVLTVSDYRGRWKCETGKCGTGSIGTMLQGVENARLALSAPKCRGGKCRTGIIGTILQGMENAGLENSGTGKVWNATCGIHCTYEHREHTYNGVWCEICVHFRRFLFQYSGRFSELLGHIALLNALVNCMICYMNSNSIALISHRFIGRVFTVLYIMCHMYYVCFASLTADRNIVHRSKSSLRTSHNHKDQDGH